MAKSMSALRAGCLVAFMSPTIAFAPPLFSGFMHTKRPSVNKLFPPIRTALLNLHMSAASPFRPATMDAPLKFKGGKTTKNRFALASLTNCQSNPDGTLHEREAVWLERRAKDGYGIVNSCCVHVQANGKGWEGEWCAPRLARHPLSASFSDFLSRKANLF
jgi:hypothetical protein